MLEDIHENRKLQLFLGLMIGIGFGFLLDRGGATDFNIIVDQLLLKDFTVLKIMFTAILTGMIGIHLIVRYLPPELQPKPCRVKAIIVGSLIFGGGFALLGLCPGTAAGAFGTGAVHALLGILGMLSGAGLFASFYPSMTNFLNENDMGRVTIPEALDIDKRWIMLLIFVLLTSIMYIIEMKGL